MAKTVERNAAEPIAGNVAQSVHISPDEVHTTLSRHMLADGYSFVYDHRKSEGSYLVDAKSGKRYLDLFSFYASSPLSHNHPGMKDPAFRERLLDVALINPANPDVYTVEMAEFVETFTSLAIPNYLPHLFFVAGGAPAVENALKTAFDWKVRKNFAKGYAYEKGHKVLHFKEAFHGRLGYTISLTNTADPRKYMYFPRFDWPRVDNPKLEFPVDASLAEAREAESLLQIKEAFERNPDDIAAIIIEPIQGEGGDNHFRPEFFRALRHVADEYEAMLIFDEVQTGIGITGTMWAHQQLGAKPDILVFGKKTQVCGIAVSSRVDEVEHNVFVEHSRINSTWGGNLVDMVRGQRYLEIIHAERLVENARIMGEYFLGKLQELEEKDAPIGNVRGRGLFIAFDLTDMAARNKLIKDAYDNDLLLLQSGICSIRLRPHLDIKKEAIDHALGILEQLWHLR
ncbi:MAG: L-lysine 6-transaminase [Chloroflexi bacterium]|uniref:L-lysine-epsilon aminotransferase n=1 Tax=Candidatus Chlorohelix allophototropha TaxID=3003348 RepID=A0A8T7LYD8_9CHLR|nr:L-lysine 6-transaminase [Chloroflexota bacterium]WJW67197.1 L-lysine 6-transaminase [Chloroflexota bacterium L227-S17]